MNTITRWTWSIVVLVIAGGARGAIPGADDGTVYTERDYRKQMLEFNRRALVQAYLISGNDDPKWNQPATRLLRNTAFYISNSGVQKRYRLAGEGPYHNQETFGQRVIDGGCQDPLIFTALAIVYSDQNKLNEFRPMADRALAGLAGSNYPPFHAARIARRVLRDINKDTQADEFKKYDQLIYDSDLATLKMKDFPGVDRRVLYHEIEGDFDGWATDRKKAFCDAAKDGGDQWLTDLFSAEYHIAKGWEARGHAFADKVTPEGWKVLGDEMTSAHELLEDAYKLHPKFPESATKLISVSCSDGHSEDLRKWFERAVEAQFDYEPAYESYSYSLRPQWFGSLQAMYDFGVECADTGRYDTSVPLGLLYRLQDIYLEQGNNWVFWQQPQVWQRLSDVLRTYGEHDAPFGDRAYYYSRLAGYAWQLRNYSNGRDALAAIDGKYDNKGMTMAKAIPSRTASGIYAFTGHLGSKVSEAETELAAGKIDDAIKGYEAMGGDVKGDDREFTWIRGRTQELKWDKAFGAGEQVNLIPDQSPAGWYASSGQFKGDGDAILGSCDAQGAALICGVRFGLRWELQGTFEIMPGADGKPARSTCDAGVIVAWNGSNQLMATYVRPGTKQVIWMQQGQGPWVGQREVHAQSKLVVQMWDGKVNVMIDSVPLVQDRETWAELNPLDDRIGVGCSALQPGTNFRVTDLKIRKLTAPPKH